MLCHYQRKEIGALAKEGQNILIKKIQQISTLHFPRESKFSVKTDGKQMENTLIYTLKYPQGKTALKQGLFCLFHQFYC